MTPDVQMGTAPFYRVQDTSNGLACRDCGIRIEPGDEHVTLTANAVQRRIGGNKGPVITEDREMKVRMGVCGTCASRRERASRLLDSHPSVVRALGSRSYVDNLVDSALVVFDALGVELPASLEKSSDKKFGLLVETLPLFGSLARWSTLFVPTVLIDADLSTPAPMRWWHVKDPQRQDLQDAYGKFLLDLTDTPRPVAPPEDGMRGCLLCGVGTIPAMKSERFPWGELRRGGDRVLGGPGSATAHVGYLCPACQKAAQKAGRGLGPSAMEFSLFNFLGVHPAEYPDDKVGKFGRAGVTLRGLQAWCTLPAGTSPNEKPWSHVRGQERLIERLKKLQTTGGLRRVS